MVTNSGYHKGVFVIDTSSGMMFAVIHILQGQLLILHL